MTSCASPRLISSAPESEIVRLNTEYSILENLGKGPVKANRRENLVRYGFKKDDGRYEYLLVLFPEQIDGTISINLTQMGKNAVLTEGDKTFFDLLLRAHRRVLNLKLDDAKQILKALKKDYGDNYGVAVLEGNIAVMEGRFKDARDHYAMAKAIYPKEEALNELVSFEQN